MPPSGLAPQYRVYALFAIYAFGLGNIFPRLPDVQRGMGVEEGALGLALTGTPLGTLVALSFGGPLVERIGFRTSFAVLLPVMFVAFAVAVNAPGPLWFFLALIPAGLAIGCVEIMVNLEADRTEAMIGRRIMNRSHAFWSFGFFGAGLSGSAFAAAGVSPQVHLAVLVPAGVALVALAMRGYVPAPARATGSAAPAPRFALPNAGILLLVAATLPALMAEGASMDWSAIHMVEAYDAPPFLAGIAVAAFGLSQATARYFGDRFVERHSPLRVARVLNAVMLAGALAVFLAPSPAVGLAGFVLLGIGTSTLFPLGISAAARRTDRPAAVNVAALAQTSFVAFLLGPPLLGFVAEHLGTEWVFGLCVPLVVVSFLASGALDPDART